MAIDIAFVLGVLAILGSRIPLSLKIFVTPLAIADDLIAVLAIAIFYADRIQVIGLPPATRSLNTEVLNPECPRLRGW